MNDFRFAFRQLLKRPGFTTVAVITLALGIGASTAIFSVINAALLRPPPFPEPQRLVAISESNASGQNVSASYPNFLDWQREQEAFSSMAAYKENGWNLTGSDRPERVTGLQVSASFFPTLGVPPMHGRVFTAEEDKPGGERVVVLSEGLWRRRFGGDTRVLNQPVKLDGEPYLVIGIMPAAFQFPRRVELWTPLGYQAPWTNSRGWHPGIFALGRLKPGVDIDTAREQLKTIAARLALEYPNTNTSATVGVIPLQERIAGPNVQMALKTLLGAVFMVLLIACTNVTNLLLARAVQRRKEMAVRLALGAGRWRILRHLLAENLVLAAAGGIGGLLLAHASLGALGTLLPAELLEMVRLEIDRSVLMFALAATTFTGVVFGFAPAWHLARGSSGALTEAGLNERAGSGWGWGRRALVVAEVAIALVLLVSAGLLIRSFSRLQAVQVGLQPRDVLTMELSLPHYKYPDRPRQTAFYKQVVDVVRVLPGVVSAAFVTPMPIAHGGWSADAWFHGEPIPDSGPPTSDFVVVTPDYFKTLGVSLLKGRAFSESDDGRNRVCIVDQVMESMHFRGDALGKRMALAGTNWMTVVGVVGHVKNNGASAESRACTYLPIAQDALGWMTLAIKTSVKPSSLTEPIRRAILSIDPDQPVTNIRTMEEIFTRNLADRRLTLILLNLFSGLALLLAAVGLYGLLAFNVANRTREIGVRMALGAQARDVLSLVLRQGSQLVTLGIILGLACAFPLTRLLASLLFETPANDWLTYLATAVVLSVVGLVACWLPARRAARVDPLEALRCE